MNINGTGDMLYVMLLQKYEVIYRYFVEYLIETGFCRHTVGSHYAILCCKSITKYYSLYQKHSDIIKQLIKRFTKFLQQCNDAYMIYNTILKHIHYIILPIISYSITPVIL